MADNKSSLQNILQAVLSVANSEQSMAYSPLVFQNHFNIVTSFLLDAFSKVYPDKLDIFLGFISSQKIPVTNGYIQLPPEYRNLLGAPSINVNTTGGDCTGISINNETQFVAAKLKSGCKSYFVEIVSKKEWDSRTGSTYAFPTYKNPIGLYIGERRIKLCPYDLASVEVTFLKKEKSYVYGYITQPDDTFLFDESTSVESQWTDAASHYLFQGCLSLYGAYARDNSITEYSQILNKLGLF